MNDVKVSIIIPVYNVEKYLKKCIDSALNQTFKDIEVIAVNDGSTDNSVEILKSYSDNRLKIISQENQGLSGARNTGIKNAKGEYLFFLDSDDYIELNTIETLYRTIVNSQIDIVLFGYTQLNEMNEIIYKNIEFLNLKKDDYFRRILSSLASSMACNKLFKKDLFINNNIFFPLGLYHEDVFTIYKLFYFAKDIQVVEKYFYNWLKRDGSISKSITDKHIGDFRKILYDTKNFLLDNKVYENYEKEYVRRCLHFLFGLTDRINYTIKDETIKKEMRAKVWELLVELKLNNDNTLTLIKQIDNKLYLKLKGKLEYSRLNKKNKERIDMLNRTIDILLPIGSARREFVKKILYGKNYTPIIHTKKINKDCRKKSLINDLVEISVKEQKLLKQFKNKHKGKRCFIVGNGPSLNKCDLSLLKDEYTFAVNGIFYKTEEMGFKPTFYMVEDGHVVDDNLKKINEYNPTFKFFPALYKDKIVKTDNTYFFTADLGFYRGSYYSFEIPRFSRDFSQIAFCGQSVTYLNMQLAFYMGFSEVYLIGMDFSYNVRGTDEKRGATLITHDEDINHFHPDYFGKGKKWHDPKVHNVAKNYEYAKMVYEWNGRKIYNATIGGKLEIFERVDYYSLFK